MPYALCHLPMLGMLWRRQDGVMANRSLARWFLGILGVGVGLYTSQHSSGLVQAHPAAQCWVSVWDSEVVFCPQHKAAVKASPLRSEWVPASRMRLLRQEGVPAAQEHLWQTVPLGRAGTAAAQMSHACPNSCHALLPSLLWDSPATSLFLMHEVRGCVVCGSACSCSTAAGASWGALYHQHSP